MPASPNRAEAAPRQRVRTLTAFAALATLALLALPTPILGADPLSSRVAEVERVYAKLRPEVHVHDDGSQHTHPASGLSAADLAVIGLRQGSGPCIGLLETNGPADEHHCTHGPDVAPGSPAGAGTAADGPYPPPPGWTTPTKIPCYTSGPFVQVLWVYVQGTPSHLASHAEIVRREVAAADLMFNISAQRVNGPDGQPSIRHVKWAHDAGCNLTITPAAVPASVFMSAGATADYLRAHGVITSSKKYLAFLDTDGCGGGEAEIPGGDSPSPSNWNNLGGSYGETKGCLDGSPFLPDWQTAIITAHELTHTLGAVMDSAPHSTGGHCWDDIGTPNHGTDIMCYADGYPGPFIRPAACPLTTPETLDCRKDDYFNPNPASGNYLATHWNTAKNQFLSTVEPPSYFTIPLATASVPGNGSYIGGLHTVTIGTTAPAGRTIAYVDVTVGTAAPLRLYAAPYTVEIDTFELLNLSKLPVKAQPFDDLGYPGSSASANFTIANPQVHLDTPSLNAVSSPIASWSATATAAGDRTIAKVQPLNEFGDPIGSPDVTAPYGGTIDLSAFAGGFGLSATGLAVEVTDSAGVSRATPTRYFYLARPEVIQPYSEYDFQPTPINAGSHRLAAILNTPRGLTISKVEFRVNNVKVGEDATAPYTYNWTAVAGTSATVRARAFDDKGLITGSTTGYITVVSDGMGATLTSPAHDAAISGSNVTVTVTPTVPAGLTTSSVAVSDPSGFVYTYLAPVDEANPSGPWTGVLDVSYQANGRLNLRPVVHAYDDSFNDHEVQGSNSVVRVANPAPTVSLGGPANGATVNQTVNLTASVAANGATIYGVSYQIGGYDTGINDVAPYSFAWETYPYEPDGTVQVVAVVWSDRGQTYSAPRTYTVRNVVAWLSTPVANQTISGTYTFKGRGRCDSDCLLTKASLFIDGVLRKTDGTPPYYDMPIDTRTFADGAHTFAMRVLTNDGRTAWTATRTLYVDNTP
jgi:hypothetical protein